MKKILDKMWNIIAVSSSEVEEGFSVMNNIVAVKKLSLIFEASSSAKMLTIGATEVSSRAWMWFLHGSWFPGWLLSRLSW